MWFDESAVCEPIARQKLTLAWRGKTAPVADVIFDDVTAIHKGEANCAPRVLRVDPWVERTGLDLCLGHWVDWMHQDDRDLGVKSQAGIKSGPDHADDHEGYDDGAASDAAIARASREIAMATDAMIGGLPRHYKAAIERRCNIASVWRFPNMDFTATLPEAEKELTAKLAKNVATKVFF